jgi:hypothetical protein
MCEKEVLPLTNPAQSWTPEHTTMRPLTSPTELDRHAEPSNMHNLG